ncbi:MAG TPA: hypothetical protein VGN46_08915 [Luteibacter sp.]|jgi:hypothetical protein
MLIDFASPKHENERHVLAADGVPVEMPQVIRVILIKVTGIQ